MTRRACGCLLLAGFLVLGAGEAALGGEAQPGAYAGKRVLHVDSYHRGNAWNDRIADAVAATLAGTGVELEILHMDTKRHDSEAFGREAALKVKARIEVFRPDVVTTSDDNAAKYLIMEHYEDADLPFVFCGLNWDASIYGLPYRNVTGMVEVSPIPQLVGLLKSHARGPRLGYLAENTETKRKELEYHERLFGIRYDQVYLVDSFAQWRDAFLQAQDEVDALLILGVAKVTDWNDAEAVRLAETATRIPTGTDFEWLMNVTMLGVAKSPEEQGRWAAKAALKILDGVSPRQIPLAYNEEGKLLFNARIGALVGVTDPPRLAELVR
jgi:ABC-type uncharacterized transport system substrate-binding protein